MGEGGSGNAVSSITLVLTVRTQWILVWINDAINEIVKYWLKGKYGLKVLSQTVWLSILFYPLLSRQRSSMSSCFPEAQKERALLDQTFIYTPSWQSGPYQNALLKSQRRRVAQFGFSGGMTSYYHYFSPVVTCMSVCRLCMRD